MSPRRPAVPRGPRGPLGLSLSAGATGTVGVGLAAVAVSAMTAGWRGVGSATVGLFVVLIFFAVSFVLVELANQVDPALTMAAGVTIYSTLVVVLGVLAFGTTLVDRLSRSEFALTVVAGTLGWVIAQCVAVWRSQTPYVQVDLPRTPGSDRHEPTDTVPPS